MIKPQSRTVAEEIVSFYTLGKLALPIVVWLVILIIAVLDGLTDRALDAAGLTRLLQIYLPVFLLTGWAAAVLPAKGRLSYSIIFIFTILSLFLLINGLMLAVSRQIELPITLYSIFIFADILVIGYLIARQREYVGGHWPVVSPKVWQAILDAPISLILIYFTCLMMLAVIVQAILTVISLYSGGFYIAPLIVPSQSVGLLFVINQLLMLLIPAIILVALVLLGRRLLALLETASLAGLCLTMVHLSTFSLAVKLGSVVVAAIGGGQWQFLPPAWLTVLALFDVLAISYFSTLSVKGKNHTRLAVLAVATAILLVGSQLTFRYGYRTVTIGETAEQGVSLHYPIWVGLERPSTSVYQFIYYRLEWRPFAGFATERRTAMQLNYRPSRGEASAAESASQSLPNGLERIVLNDVYGRLTILYRPADQAIVDRLLANLGN